MNTIQQAIELLKNINLNNATSENTVLEIEDCSSNNIESNTDDCPICLEVFTDKNLVILECGHKIHLQCYHQFLFTSTGYTNTKKCMLCRSEINLPFGFSSVVDNLEIQLRRRQIDLERRERRRIAIIQRQQEQQQQRVVEAENAVTLHGVMLDNRLTIQWNRYNANVPVNRTFTYNNRSNIANILYNRLEHSRFYTCTEAKEALRLLGITRSINNISIGFRRLSNINYCLSGYNFNNNRGFILLD